MSHATVCLLVLAVTVALLVWNRLPVELVALGSALVLYATGVLTAGQVFAGFGDPVVGFIAALFVVGEALVASGATAWAGQQLAARAGASYRRLLVLVMLVAAGLTTLISVNGATAALLPMVVLLAAQLGHPPSRLAMPLAFAGHAASLLVLTATPINVLVSDAAKSAGGKGFGFFEFAVVGVPLLAGTLAIGVLGADRLLPARTPRSLPADLSGHSRTLVDAYRLDAHAAGLRVLDGSPAEGRLATDLATDGVAVVGAIAPDRVTVRDREPLRPGDVVVVRGGGAAVDRFAAGQGLQPLPREVADKLAGLLLTRTLGAAELVIRPRSRIVGDTVYPGMSTDNGELVVLAVARHGRHLDAAPVTLAPGDTVLLRGTWSALDRYTAASGDLLVVDPPAAVRRQALPLGPGSRRAIAILLGMVALLASGAVPPAIAALLAAGAMVLTRVITMRQAYDGVSWTTLVIVAGMFPLSIAMRESGAADRLAHVVVTVFGGGGHLLLLGLFLLTAALGQVVSNMATALIVIPIAVSVAADTGVSVRPVLMTIAIAASAALLTPIATPANLMVQGPGGYRFGDYARLGLPVLGWYLVVAVGLVPLVWRF